MIGGTVIWKDKLGFFPTNIFIKISHMIFCLLGIIFAFMFSLDGFNPMAILIGIICAYLFFLVMAMMVDESINLLTITTQGIIAKKTDKFLFGGLNIMHYVRGGAWEIPYREISGIIIGKYSGYTDSIGNYMRIRWKKDANTTHHHFHYNLKKETIMMLKEFFEKRGIPTRGFETYNDNRG